MGGNDANEPLPRQCSWQPTIAALREHGLLAVAADAIMSLPKDHMPDSKLQMEVMQSVTIARLHHRLNNTIGEVFRILCGAGLHPVLLKGQGLATLYPKLFTRSCGDIDIFLMPEEFQEGCEIIFDYCGVPCQTPFALPSNHLHLTAYKDKDTRFEIHYQPALTAIADIRDEYNEWMIRHLRWTDSVRIGGTTVAVPRVQVNAVYVFEHLLKHLRSGGVGLRQFVDWMLLLHHAAGSIDHRQLRRDLRRFHLLDAWQVLGGILVWQLGLPESEFPLWNPRKARHSQGRNLDYIVCAGNLGRTLGDYKGYYYMPVSFRRDLMALRYAWRYQRFMYHVLPYDTPRHVWCDVKRTIKNHIKRL